MFGLKLFFTMLRPRVSYILLLFAALGVAQGGYKHQLAWQYLIIAVVVAAWYVNATTINDLADYEIDQINLKGASERPLVNRQVRRKQIVRLSVFSGALAMVTGLLLDLRIGVLVAVCLVLNYVYSMPPIRISYRGALAPLLLPIGYIVLPYLVGAWAVKEDLTPHGQLILVALYISFVGRILLKDFRDVKGDAKFGKLTFILRYGRKATCIASALGLAIGSTILLWVIPHQVIIIVIFEALLACSLFGLYRLYRTSGRNHEQLIINSVVRTAGGVVILLLALITAQNQGSQLWEETLLTVMLGPFFMAMFWDMLKQADRLKANA